MGYSSPRMSFNELDNQLFQFFNQKLTSTEFDNIAPIISSSTTWWVAAFIIFVFGLVLKRKNWLKALLIGGIALGAADAINGHILKQEFQRLRPCYQKEVVLRANSCGSRFGMPSNHAANGAALLVASSFFISGLDLGLVALMVFLVGWSRIYLGVHFPFDVLAGWAVGGVVGAGVAKILLKLNTYLRSFR